MSMILKLYIIINCGPFKLMGTLLNKMVTLIVIVFDEKP